MHGRITVFTLQSLTCRVWWAWSLTRHVVYTHQARGIHSPGTWYTLTRHVVYTHQARGIHSPGMWYTLTRHVVYYLLQVSCL